MASSATPTSANTASHMVANPMAPMVKNTPLTIKAKQMFCQTITRVIDSQLRERFQSTWSGCLGGAILEEDYWQMGLPPMFFLVD